MPNCLIGRPSSQLSLQLIRILQLCIISMFFSKFNHNKRINCNFKFITDRLFYKGELVGCSFVLHISFRLVLPNVTISGVIIN